MDEDKVFEKFLEIGKQDCVQRAQEMVEEIFLDENSGEGAEQKLEQFKTTKEYQEKVQSWLDKDRFLKILCSPDTKDNVPLMLVFSVKREEIMWGLIDEDAQKEIGAWVHAHQKEIDREVEALIQECADRAIPEIEKRLKIGEISWGTNIAKLNDISNRHEGEVELSKSTIQDFLAGNKNISAASVANALGLSGGRDGIINWVAGQCIEQHGELAMLKEKHGLPMEGLRYCIAGECPDLLVWLKVDDYFKNPKIEALASQNPRYRHLFDEKTINDGTIRTGGWMTIYASEN